MQVQQIILLFTYVCTSTMLEIMVSIQDMVQPKTKVRHLVEPYTWHLNYAHGDVTESFVLRAYTFEHTYIHSVRNKKQVSDGQLP